MIKTRSRKIIRDVLSRKGRTALVSIAIFIGVTGTIALFSMSDILIRQLKEDIKEDELAMGQISVAADPGAQIDNAEILRLLDSYPGVTSVMGGLEEIVIYFKTAETDESFEEGEVQAYVVLNDEGTALANAPFETDAPIEPIRLLEGNWPNESVSEVAIEQRMADEYDLGVGDTLYLRILSPSRDPEQNGATGTLEAWTVSGIVFDPYSIAPKGGVYAYLSDANYLTGRTGFNDFWVRFTDYPTAEAEFDDFQSLIAEETPYTPAFALSEDPAENSLITGAQTITNLMSFLALVALVVSGFLVINVVSSLVLEQKQQIGVMKSIGATRWDNFFIYSGIAFVYGLIAVIPGVIIGIPAGNAAANALAPQLNTVLKGFNISVPSIVLGVLVGLLIPVLASLIPVFNGTRVQILDALTDLGIGSRYGTGWFARFLGALPVPITIRQGLSNVSQKKMRLAFTVITLAIAVGAFMGIYAMFATLTDGIQLFIDSFNVQIAVFPSEAGDPQEFSKLLLDNFPDDIEVLEPGMQLQVEFEGYDPEPAAGGPPGIFAYGYDINSETPAFNFEIDEGEQLTDATKDTGIILSSLLAANMNKELGDTVVLKTPGGSKDFEVIGISEFPLEQVWIDWRTLANVAGFTFDKIEGGSPLNNMIPDEARNFVKYASMVTVEGYESAGSMPGTLVMGFTPNIAQYLVFKDGDFFTTTPEAGEVIVSSAMAEQGNYSVGDTITLASTLDSGTSASYRIAGIFAPPALLQASPPTGEASAFELPPDFIGMFWRDATQLDNAAVTSEPRSGAFFITTPLDDPTADELGDIADDINDTLASAGAPAFILNFVELTDQISEIFVTIQVILSAVAGLIALVGALGLLTTLSMSVFERQKEIGVMRSIGASSSTVATQFLTEGLVVGVIAWIVGLPLMAGIQVLLLSITGFNETFPFEFSVEAVIIGLIGMLIITTIASLWPSLGAARKTVSDILRYQ
jgi:ABC-type antimicrobial peptide transport system permease subunit